MSYVVLGIVAGLASVERKGFLQAMLARPIALGTLLGFALGDVPGGLLLAVPLELFWLGAVNLGAALPVHEALGTAAITGGAILAGQAMGTGVTPEIAVLAALLCAPLALLGRRADRLTEIWNEGLARRAERVLAAGRPAAAARSNVYGLALPFLIGAVLAPAGAFLAALLVPALLGRAPAAAAPLAGAWAAFAGLACASGAKALRARAAAPVFFLALAAATAVGLTWWRLA